MAAVSDPLSGFVWTRPAPSSESANSQSLEADVKKLLILTMLVTAGALLTAPAWAQQDQVAALFGGYSLLRLDQGDNLDRATVHGFAADYTYFMDRRFGFVVSGSYHKGPADVGANGFGVGDFDFREYTLLAGPHAVLWRGHTSEAGLRALAGAGWRRFETGDAGLEVSADVEFTWAIEAHLDLRLSDNVWLRVAQPAVVRTRFDDITRTDYRLSIGLVLHAGSMLQ